MKTSRNLLFSALALVISGIMPVFGQQNLPPQQKMKTHQEQPDQPYLPTTGFPRNTSPAKKFESQGFFTTQVNVDANGNNIVGDAANEPSIAIDPTNPDRMAIGWRQFDDVNNSFRQAGYGYSTDGGLHWTFPGKIEPGIFRSDPVLDADHLGNFYYNSLTSNAGVYTCKVFKSSDGGVTWDAGTEARGGDKQWMVIDRSGSQGNGNIYSFWSSFYSSCAPGFFTRSADGGASYEYCVEITGNPFWGNMAVGPDGELYIVGNGSFDGVVVAKSISACIPGSNVTWSFSTQVDLDGYLTSQSEVNPGGIMGQANICVDQSDGPGRGNVYVLASVVRNSNGDPGDVMFAKSTDGGNTFSLPQRINNDPGAYNYQWFGTMSVAPNGRIDIIWLDTRDDIPGSLFSSLYYCFSSDQGTTWSINKRLSEMFDPHQGWPQQQKMGDYFDLKSDETGAHLAWANTLNNEQDVYYSHIIPEIVSVPETSGAAARASLLVYPNPVSEKALIQYSLPGTSEVRLTISNIYGQEIRSLVAQSQPAGSFSTEFSVSDLVPGCYICTLSTGKEKITARIVKI